MAGEVVLIVDDDRNIRKLIESYLVSAGFKVVQASSGEEGIGTMEANPPDLVLLDVQMQGMDGFQTIQAIRKNRKFLHTPILFLTSAAHTDVKVRGLEADADDYILKTVPKEELIARMRAALRRNQRFRESAGEGLMVGHLNNVSLADLVQNIGASGKTASMTLNEMDAAIYIENGQLLHAEKGTFTGKGALARIFMEEKGSFSVAFDKLPPEIPKNPEPVMSVLMAVLAKVDEVREHVTRMKLDQCLVNIDFELAEYSDFKEFRERSPVPFMDLLVGLPGTLMGNLKEIVQAVKDKELHLIRTQ